MCRFDGSDLWIGSIWKQEWIGFVIANFSSFVFVKEPAQGVRDLTLFLKLWLTLMHACMHACTPMNRRTRTRTCACTRARACALARAHTRMHTQTHIEKLSITRKLNLEILYVCLQILHCTPFLLRVYAYVCTHVRVDACMYECAYVCTRVRVHVYGKKGGRTGRGEWKALHIYIHSNWMTFFEEEARKRKTHTHAHVRSRYTHTCAHVTHLEALSQKRRASPCITRKNHKMCTQHVL